MHTALKRAAIACGIATSLAFSSPASAVVEGYVDLHSHLMGEHSFGGSWFWGRTEGPLQDALERCDGNINFQIGNGSHAATIFPGVSEGLGADTGWHWNRRRGYDKRRCRYFFWIPIPGTCPKEHFEDWPKWDAIAHQQMWVGHMQRARDRGLKIMGVSLAESEFLCSATPPLRRRYDCDEMASIKRQAQLVREYAARNSAWVGIAETPAQARALIDQGKLALVLTAEVTKLFPTGDYVQQLDELLALGIRSLQLVHHADNRFAGTAPINSLRTAASLAELLTGGNINTQINDTICRDASGGVQLGAPPFFLPKCDGDQYLNDRGLTADGRDLVNAMMDRGMILDVSHLSRKGFRETYQLAVARSNYPLTYSHTHMWDTINDEHKNEKYLRADEIDMIVSTGGMIGLRTGPEAANTYIRPPMAAPYVGNSCAGSVRSFAQSLIYAVDKGLNVGFGADLNGFTPQTKGVMTRFSSGLLSDPFYLPVGCTQDYSQLGGNAGLGELHKKGLGHVGLLPDYIADLKRVGVPPQYMQPLEKNSAEIYLQIWERSRQIAGNPLVNIAPIAVASASSTYCVGPPQTSPDCYAPWRVNDGNASSALGGQTSWANNWGVAMPQWVQLEWATPVTVSRTVVTTTAGFVMQDYDVQVWIGPPQSGFWQTVATRNNNANITNAHPFAQTTTTRLRVLGRRGSVAQPGYVRVNEIAVF